MRPSPPLQHFRRWVRCREASDQERILREAVEPTLARERFTPCFPAARHDCFDVEPTGVMMSVDTIRVVLGRLQDEPESEAAWEQLAESVTSPGDPGVEMLRLLEEARARF